MNDLTNLTSLPEAPLNQSQIQALIPHRYPMLLVDRVLGWEFEPTPSIRALKNVSFNEPFFQGHFPGHPVMPGVLIIEAMAQAAGVLGALTQMAYGKKSDLYYLVKVEGARFNQVVTPGDQLLLEVTEKRRMRGMGLFACVASVEGKQVACCEILSAGRS